MIIMILVGIVALVILMKNFGAILKFAGFFLLFLVLMLFVGLFGWKVASILLILGVVGVIFLILTAVVSFIKNIF